MADYEFPDELLEAQRDLYSAIALVKKLAGALPLSTPVLAGEVEPASDEQRAELAAAREEQLRCVRILYGHTWFETVGEGEKEARLALQQAAKA